MVEPFIGTWTFIKNDKFDQYLEAVGVCYTTQQIGIIARPTVVISKEDDGYYTLRTITTFKKTEFKFKLNEKGDETTLDGRNTKTIMTVEDGKLVQKQTWDGKETTIEHEIQDGRLIVVMS